MVSVSLHVRAVLSRLMQLCTFGREHPVRLKHFSEVVVAAMCNVYIVWSFVSEECPQSKMLE